MAKNNKAGGGCSTCTKLKRRSIPTPVQREVESFIQFFFFTALVSRWLLLLRFKCKRIELRADFPPSHLTMPDERHQTKELLKHFFPRSVNVSTKPAEIYSLQPNTVWTNLFFLFLIDKIRILVLGVSLWLSWCVFFFRYYYFLSLALILWYLVFCSVKAVNRSLHLCIWKVSLLKYFCLFYYFRFFFSTFFSPLVF